MKQHRLWPIRRELECGGPRRYTRSKQRIRGAVTSVSN
jgi:hypothetical protein